MPSMIRPFLIEILDNTPVFGVEWVSRTEGKFRIIWLDKRKNGWTEEHGRIFMLWARHTGKYSEGTMDENYSKWKLTLRMALKNSPDIRRVDNQQNTDSTPYNYYQFTQPVTHLAGGTHHKSNHADHGIHADSLIMDYNDLNDIAASIGSINLTEDMKLISPGVAWNSQTGKLNKFSDMDIDNCPSKEQQELQLPLAQPSDNVQKSTCDLDIISIVPVTVAALDCKDSACICLSES